MANFLIEFIEGAAASVAKRMERRAAQKAEQEALKKGSGRGGADYVAEADGTVRRGPNQSYDVAPQGSPKTNQNPGVEPEDLEFLGASGGGPIGPEPRQRRERIEGPKRAEPDKPADPPAPTSAPVPPAPPQPPTPPKSDKPDGDKKSVLGRAWDSLGEKGRLAVLALGTYLGYQTLGNVAYQVDTRVGEKGKFTPITEPFAIADAELKDLFSMVGTSISGARSSQKIGGLENDGSDYGRTVAAKWLEDPEYFAKVHTMMSDPKTANTVLPPIAAAYLSNQQKAVGTTNLEAANLSAEADKQGQARRNSALTQSQINFNMDR